MSITLSAPEHEKVHLQPKWGERPREPTKVGRGVLTAPTLETSCGGRGEWNAGITLIRGAVRTPRPASLDLKFFIICRKTPVFVCRCATFAKRCAIATLWYPTEFPWRP